MNSSPDSLKLEALKIEEELTLRELAARRLEDFVTYTMPDFYVEEYHRKLFDALERVERGELKRLMVFMPPRSGKTEIISKRFPAWCLGRNQKHQVVASSYGADLANEFGRKAKHITQSDEYKNVFPEFTLADDKREGGNWETQDGGGYYAVGVGGALTGRGFTIGLIDDPVKNREDAESLTIRDKVWDWYTSTFYTRQQGSTAAIVVLMTRWNTDDLAGRILELEKDKWEVIIFPAIENGKALCNRPGFGLSFYTEQQQAIGVRDFAALYQQDPISSTGAIFKKDNFRYFSFGDIDPKELDVGIFVDPAFSSREDSDDTAILVVGKHKTSKELYVIDCFGEPVLPSDAHRYMLSLASKVTSMGFNKPFFSIEEVAISKNQKLFISEFDRRMREAGVFYTVLNFNPASHGKKEDRIRYTLEPVFDRHVMHFRADDSGNLNWMKLEEQLLKFPASRHDDLSDVLAQSVIVWEGRSGFNEDVTIDGAKDYLRNLMRRNQPVDIV